MKPLGDLDLEFDQIKASGAFGDRVFNLQPGIHLHEPETMALWFAEEFDGAGVAVSCGFAQTNCSLPEFFIFVGRKSRRRCFFQNFLVPALNRAISNAYGPRGSMLIGNDLDLDVAGVLHSFLEEDCRVSECLKGLRAGGFKRLG
jgi:hypothetical protein